MLEKNCMVESMVESARLRLADTIFYWGEDSCREIKALQHLADLCVALGRHNEAKLLYWRILYIQQRKYGHTNIVLADTWLSLGELYELEQSLESAERMYEQGLFIVDSHTNSHSSDLFGEFLLRLYNAFQANGKNADAEFVQERLLSFLDRRARKIDHEQPLGAQALAA